MQISEFGQLTTGCVAAVLAAALLAGCAGPQHPGERAGLFRTVSGATADSDGAGGGMDAMAVLASLRRDEGAGQHDDSSRPSRPAQQDSGPDPAAQRAYIAGSLVRLASGAIDTTAGESPAIAGRPVATVTHMPAFIHPRTAISPDAEQ